MMAALPSEDIDRRLTLARRAVAAAGDPARRVRALAALAMVTADHDHVAGLALADEAMGVARGLDDAVLVAEARLARGLNLVELTRYEEATAELASAAGTFEVSGVVTGLGQALCHLACIHTYTGEPEAALDLLARADALLASTGDEDSLGRVANDRGNACVLLGRYDEAEAAYVIAARRFARLGAHVWQAIIANNRATIAQSRHMVEPTAETRRGLERSRDDVALARRADPGGAAGAFLLATEAGIELELGRTGRALVLADEARAVGRSIGNDRLVAAADMVAGMALRRAGDHEAAVELLRAAVQGLERVGHREAIAEAVGELADALEACGDVAGALAAFRSFHAAGSASSPDLQRLRSELVDARIVLERTRHAVELQRLRAAALVDENESLRQQRDALGVAARRDALTGLLNRGALDEELGRLTAAGEAPLALALLDVDDFKALNDGWSHLVGDEVLRVLAGVIAEACRDGDVVARYGGEEFAIVLGGATRAEALAVCERVRAAVEGHRWAEVAPGVGVTVSIGCVEAEPGAAPTDVLAAADALLYAAKGAGRNRVIAG